MTDDDCLINKSDHDNLNKVLNDVTNYKENIGNDKDKINQTNNELKLIDVNKLKIPVQEGKLWLKKNIQVLNVCFQDQKFSKYF